MVPTLLAEQLSGQSEIRQHGGACPLFANPGLEPDTISVTYPTTDGDFYNRKPIFATDFTILKHTLVHFSVIGADPH
jgi:hypothetical protein